MGRPHMRPVLHVKPHLGTRTPFPVQLLSHATDPLRIQPHLIRCFEGVHRLRFKDANSGSPVRRRSSGRQLWSRLSGRDTVVEGDDDTTDAKAQQWKQSMVRASLGSVNNPSEPGAAPVKVGAGALLRRITMGGALGTVRKRTSIATVANAMVLRRGRLEAGEPKATPADLRIVALRSEVGEEVVLLREVDPKHRSVEAWMGDLEVAMKDTVQSDIVRCLGDFDPAERTLWVEVRFPIVGGAPSSVCVRCV
jgi:hypothetical protein